MVPAQTETTAFNPDPPDSGIIGTVLGVLLLPLVVAWTFRKTTAVILLLVVAGIATGTISTVPAVDDPIRELSEDLGGLTQAQAEPGSGARQTTQAPGEVPPGYNESLPDGDINRSKVEQLVFSELNEYRQEENRGQIRWMDSIRGAARSHSRDMAVADYFAHESPDGETLKDRFFDARVDCTGPGGTFHGGENIAKTYAFVRVETPDGVEEYSTEMELATAILEMWINSDPHREHMLARSAKYGGVGVYLEEEGRGLAVYVTLDICHDADGQY